MVLFEKRATRSDDRWSGQVAFPGGKFKDGDVTLDKTACREFFEETGVEICGSGELIGFMDPLSPMNLPSLMVTPFVLILEQDADFRFNPSEEVESLFWADLMNLSYVETEVYSSSGKIRWRALAYEGNIVWGMTQRIIEELVKNMKGAGT
jgi:8-oxo-dGTP diphosphatase